MEEKLNYLLDKVNRILEILESEEETEEVTDNDDDENELSTEPGVDSPTT